MSGPLCIAPYFPDRRCFVLHVAGIPGNVLNDDIHEGIRPAGRSAPTRSSDTFVPPVIIGADIW